MATQINRLDVVRYSTGTTYIVVGDETEDPSRPGKLAVIGWKNGRRFGAQRNIETAKCTVIGSAKFTEEGWSFTPST